MWLRIQRIHPLLWSEERPNGHGGVQNHRDVGDGILESPRLSHTPNQWYFVWPQFIIPIDGGFYYFG